MSMKGVIFYSKCDLKSAFRILPLFVEDRAWLIMMAKDPKTGKKYYFIEKNLPFGASISCALFQEFSDSLQHITEHLIGEKDRVTNYLDDFLFIALLEIRCNQIMETFVEMCKTINCPLSPEKSEAASLLMIFLGVLLNGFWHCLALPEEKRTKALNQLQKVVSKRKATIKEIQSLTGLLNFLTRAIVPGRVFTRRMYSKLKITDSNGNKLKQHHHVYLDSEFKSDCHVWIQFLTHNKEQVLCRPFIDLEMFATSDELDFFTDSSGTIGYGCFFDGRWTYGIWSSQMLSLEPSIEFLELFALCAVVFTWEDRLSNTRIVIFCDNQLVVSMVNNTTSGCKGCMRLLRLLVLNNLKFNRRVSVKYVKSADNILAESVSRCKWNTFWKNAPRKTQKLPDEVPSDLLPPEKFFI